MTVWKRLALLMAAVVVAVVGGCSEKLTGGAACPRLCPGQSQPTLDTTFRVDPGMYLLDTTVASYPLLGNETNLLTANIPGRALVRAIIRFDSINVTYARAITGDSDSTFTADTVRSPIFWFTIVPQTLRATRGSDQIQFLAYDVDTLGNDTSVTVLNRLAMRNDRFIGATAPILASTLMDTTGARTLDSLYIGLDPVKFLAKLRKDRTVRLAILCSVVNNTSDGVTVNISKQTPPFLRYFASDSVGTTAAETTFSRIQTFAHSTTPATDSSLQHRLTYYPLVVQGTHLDTATALNVGGLPGRRVFLRFNLPTQIIDSANVVRATLMLMARPLPLQIASDTAVIYPSPVVSSSKVTEPAIAALFAVSSSLYSLDSVKVDPTSQKRVAIDFGPAVRNWQNVSDTLNTRSLVLKVLDEGATTLETSFWSSYAPDTANRPHIRLQYYKRQNIGLP